MYLAPREESRIIEDKNGCGWEKERKQSAQLAWLYFPKNQATSRGSPLAPRRHHEFPPCETRACFSSFTTQGFFFLRRFSVFPSVFALLRNICEPETKRVLKTKMIGVQEDVGEEAERAGAPPYFRNDYPTALSRGRGEGKLRGPLRAKTGTFLHCCFRFVHDRPASRPE